MNKDQIKKVEEEALMQYDYSTELVDSSHTNFEHTNKIHTIRCQRAFINGAKFALSMGSEWVKVEAKKPEFGQWVVCHCRIYGYYIGCYERILDSNWGQWNDGKQSGVLPPVFWQPLPTPPSK